MPSRFNTIETAPFVVEIEPDREVVAVRPVGELDIATRAEVERVVESLRAAGFVAFRLDLRHLTFIDSSGLQLVLALVRDEELAVTVVQGPADVHRAFEVTGLVDAIPFETPRFVRRVAA